MKRNYLAGIIAVLIISASQLWGADQPPTANTGDYIIGPGDILNISVWNNTDLTRMVTVLPDGKMSYPLIGIIPAGGKTLDVLEKEMKKELSVFVPNPELSVMVQQTTSMMIYVIGEVNKQGPLALNANVSVLQALAMAGGFTQWAKKDKIKIFRETNNKTEIIKVSYDDITEGKKIEQNIRLKKGDVVVVP